MQEKKIQRRLRTMTLLVVAVSILFFIGGNVISGFLTSSLNEVTETQMRREAEEYKNRILQQIEADFQVLNSLADFVKYEDTANRQRFAQQLESSNQNNDFLTMAYFPIDDDGMISTLGKELEIQVPLTSVSTEVQSVIQKAWEGESSISRLFESDMYHGRVFVYGVPVYDGDNRIGALVASDQIEIFSDILIGNTVLGGNGHIHMVGAEGNFLIKSSNAVVKEQMNTIYDGPYFAEEEKQAAKNAMLRGERISSSFTYQGASYQFLLEPIDLNGWYLLCVNTVQGLSAPTYHIVKVMQVTFFGIILLAVFLMLYGYRLLRKNKKELVQLAYHDTLTGADNLTRFTQKLEEALKESGGSVAAINIRQFPFINEIFGKEASNRLLCYIKTVLDRHLGEKEFFCRDTSDWFYLFLRETDEALIRPRLKAFMDEISSVPKASHSNYQLVLYCGVAISEKESAQQNQANILMTRVLFALERAKGPHQNNIWFYDAELHKKEELENYVESHMHQALQNGEFQLFLQPKIDLRTNALGGAEALVRWMTAEGETILPGEFIPLFERNGFCIQLDTYMLECVCKQLQAWIRQGLHPLPISVNQSKLMLYEGDYVETLCRITKRYGVPNHLITLEILEGLALENVEELNKRMLRLHEKGFRISMDDFGSGYSSLNTLSKLQIDELKFDRGFLLEISRKENERARLIMAQIVHMAKQLNMSTVAEGVETAENERMLKTIGCDYGQGYYYSKPIKAEEFSNRYLKFLKK